MHCFTDGYRRSWAMSERWGMCGIAEGFYCNLEQLMHELENFLREQRAGGAE